MRWFEKVPSRHVRATTLALLPLLFIPSSCSRDSSPPPGGLVQEREMVGDTLVVRALSGSVWPGPATLVEELAIGALEGSEEVIFGSIQDMTVDDQGGVYVFDSQVPALRYYDSEGRFVRTVGREGSGPGEYRDAVLGMALRRDGRLMIRDPRNARLTLYDPDGTPSDHWTFGSALFTSGAMVMDTADHAYLKVMAGSPEPNKPWPIVLVHLDETGQLIDTIPQPVIAGDPESSGGSFSPSKVWGWSPLGYPVVGVNEEYSFEIRPPSQPVIRVEREVPLVELHPEERGEYEAVREWMIRNKGQYMTTQPAPTPGVKPAYRNFFFSGNGDIWVHRYSTAEKTDQAVPEPAEGRPPNRSWREPILFDVFQPDGTYLGEVRVPPRTSIYVYGREKVWGVRRGEFNEQYVVRLRLTFEDSAEREGEEQG
jgi:hypothetical protein